MGERIADLAIHMFGIVGSTAGIAVLLTVAVGRLSLVAILSVAIYGIGLLAVFYCSAAYNFVSHYSWKAILRQLDHAAIYIKIAATHTPFITLEMAGWSGTFFASDRVDCGGVWPDAQALVS